MKLHLVLLATLACSALPARGNDTVESPWRLDAQFTNVTQRHARFRAPYTGANSLRPGEPAEETTDLTLYAGYRLARATELWINPEIDQGFGLSSTLGVAGFPSGEAYKVGANKPYLRLPRAFARHTVSLGGDKQKVQAGTNQLESATTADNLVLTIGKFSVIDIFDANTYAHDPRGDFLNWSVVDAGTFDYAADPWGYTMGAAAEWTHGSWTLRGGVFQMSKIPNSKIAGIHFEQRMLVAEAERRYAWQGHAGKIKLLAFSDRARMGSYDDAVALSRHTGGAPDMGPVRRFQTRAGASINLEQALTDSLGLFARAGANDGRREAYEFTEINKSVSAGLSLKGAAWLRPKDTAGIAGAVNALSDPARRYFAAGGAGILIGDGALNYAREHIVEAYYSASLPRNVALSFDYQRIVHPAYNADRGPVNIYGARLHADF